MGAVLVTRVGVVFTVGSDMQPVGVTMPMLYSPEIAIFKEPGVEVACSRMLDRERHERPDVSYRDINFMPTCRLAAGGNADYGDSGALRGSASA